MLHPFSGPRRRFNASRVRPLLYLTALGCLRLLIGCYAMVCLALVLPSSAIGQADRNAELSYAKGIIAYGEHDYLKALDYFRQAVTATPDDPDAQFYLGLTLTRIGEFNEAIAALQKTLQLDPSKRYVHYHLGLAYFQAARYKDALPQFEQALVDDPKKSATHFYLGAANFHLKHYQKALSFFEQSMSLDPSLTPSAQYYRGQALYALERDEQAQSAFEAAAAADPTTTIGLNSRRYLEALAERSREHRLFQAQGVVSYQYDDNVTIGDDVVISRESDGRMVFAFVGRLLPINKGPWRLGVEYDLFQSLHFDLDQFNIQSHTGRVFGRLKLDRVMLRAATDYTYSTLGNNRFLEAITVQPSATIRVTDQLLTVASFRYRHSNYFNQYIPSEDQKDVRDRDGWNVRPGVTQYWTFNQNRSYAQVGYHFEASRNDGTDWEYNGHQVTLGLHTPLLWGIELDVDGSYQRRDYLHVNSFDADPLSVLTTADQDKRTDNRFTTSAVLTRKVGPYFILSAGYVHTSNLSNIEFFQYNRNIWSIAVTGRY